MSHRAKDFVEYWIAEFLHPDSYEDEDSHSESAKNTAECLRAAAKQGIDSLEIEEEYGDLAGYMARLHEHIVDTQMRRDLQRA